MYKKESFYQCSLYKKEKHLNVSQFCFPDTLSLRANPKHFNDT